MIGARKNRRDEKLTDKRPLGKPPKKVGAKLDVPHCSNLPRDENQRKIGNMLNKEDDHTSQIVQDRPGLTIVPSWNWAKKQGPLVSRHLHSQSPLHISARVHDYQNLIERLVIIFPIDRYFPTKKWARILRQLFIIKYTAIFYRIQWFLNVLAYFLNVFIKKKIVKLIIQTTLTHLKKLRKKSFSDPQW